MVHRGGEHDLARPEKRARVQEHIACREVIPLGADESPRLRRLKNLDQASRAAGIFLDDDRIGAIGNRSACEDAYGLPGPHRAGKAMAGGGFADERQPRGQGGDIARAHGIAIHGGGIEWRLAALSGEVTRQYAAAGFGERDIFRAERLDAIEHAGQNLGDRHQAHFGSALYGPDLPPVFSRSLMPSIRMALSAAFNMS